MQNLRLSSFRGFHLLAHRGGVGKIVGGGGVWVILES